MTDAEKPPEPEPPGERHAMLVTELGRAVRRMGAQSVIASRAIADRFGLHTTDLEVLDLIFMRGEASAGELAEATGLTSGSVTALIDRLVRAGYVERHADPADRRRVMVRARPDAIGPIEAVYRPIQAAMSELWSSYDEAALRTVLDFVARSTDLHVGCLKDIRDTAEQQVTKRRRPRTQRIDEASKPRSSGGPSS